MRYISTRGQAPDLDFEDVMLEGLARDGGLYVPDQWPALSPEQFASFADQPYADVACEVLGPFLGGAIERPVFERIVGEAYARFRHQSVAPLVQIAPNQWIMELFHGPTLAFKDVAMQVLGGLFDHVLEKRDAHLTIVGATSGDTGSAAIEAVRGRKRADIFIMHPHGRTSDVQRRQMTTVAEPNVHNLAVKGTFDDCQNLLKAMFNDTAFRDQVHLSGVNSINWARVMSQAVYYITAAAALGARGTQRPVQFCVPTGNFGDVYAGYVAQRMGLPVRRLVVASNSNDILTRVLTTGDHTLGEVHATMSPSMDIQISSNFERLLFDMVGRDSAHVAALMASLKQDRSFTVPPAALAQIEGRFGAHRVSEDATLATIRSVYEQADMLIDPHTAVAVAAARRDLQATGDTSTPMVILSTAHPAKFPDAVEKATGIRPPLPPFLADLHTREEHYDVIDNDLAAVQQYIEQNASQH